MHLMRILEAILMIVLLLCGVNPAHLPVPDRFAFRRDAILDDVQIPLGEDMEMEAPPVVEAVTEPEETPPEVMGTTKPKRTRKPGTTLRPTRPVAPEETDEPPEVAADTEPAETDMPPDEAESTPEPTTEQELTEPQPTLALNGEEEREENADSVSPGSRGEIMLGSPELASAAPGEGFSLMIPFIYHCEDAMGAAELPYARVTLAKAQDENFPLAPDVLEQERTLVLDGGATGYAIFEDARVIEDARPGVYPVRLVVDWADQDGVNHINALTGYIRVCAYETDEEAEPVIVFTEDASDIEPVIEAFEQDCYLLGIPERMDFDNVSSSGEAQLIGMSEALAVQVMDTRDAGTWKLMATVGPLRSKDGDSALPGALVFIQADGQTVYLSPDESILLAEKPPGGGAGITDLRWPEGEGFHVYLEPHEGIPGARYTTTIVWTLVAS